MMTDVQRIMGLDEMTSTGSCGAVEGGPMGVVAPVKPAKRNWMQRRRKRLKEEKDDGKSIIPKDAEDLEPQVGDDQDGAPASSQPGPSGMPEPFIPMEVALVAPQATPRWDQPLDASQLPPNSADRPVLGAILGKTAPAKEPAIEMDVQRLFGLTPEAPMSSLTASPSGESLIDSPMPSPTAAPITEQVSSAARLLALTRRFKV